MSAATNPNPCIPIDCSPLAQDERWKQLRELMGKLYSGVQSVSDRSRSVTYHDSNTLRKLINGLQQEIALCAGCSGRRSMARRIFYVPYDRWL